jgi:hypothetical protein
MNINATIFAQAFNFIIVYWMLRFFLFKPVIGIIEHEKMQENAMIDIIDQQKKSLEIQEKERQRHWSICQEYFNTHQPHLLKETSFLIDDTQHNETTIELAPEAIAHIIADVEGIIEEKIKHVY